MNKLTELLVTKAYAQFDTGQSTTQNTFSITDFSFLNPFKPAPGAAAGSFNLVFGRIVGLVLTVAAIIAFVYLLIAGFQYITSGGDAAKATTARQGIINALIGILVILISYLLLRYVGTAVLGSGDAGIVGQ